MKRLIFMVFSFFCIFNIYSLEIDPASISQWNNIVILRESFKKALSNNQDPGSVETIIKLYDSKLKSLFNSQIKFKLEEDKIYQDNIFKIIEFQIREASINERTLEIEFEVYVIIDTIIELAEEVNIQNVITFKINDEKYGFDDLVLADERRVPIHRSWINIYPQVISAGQRGEIYLKMNVLLRDLMLCKIVYFD